MFRAQIVLLGLVTASILLQQPIHAQPRRVDLRAHWGHTYGLEDTPPQAWVGGGSVTAAVGPRLRLGVEVLHANLFGKHHQYKRRAILVTPVAEYEFLPGSRFNPYMVVGLGYTRYRTLEPNPRHFFDPSLPEFYWRKQGSINLSSGLGVRLFLTKHLFLAPEVRIGLAPVLRSTVSVGFTF